MIIVDLSHDFVARSLKTCACLKKPGNDLMKRAWDLGYRGGRDLLRQIEPVPGREGLFQLAIYKLLAIDCSGEPSIIVPENLNDRAWNEQIRQWQFGQANLLGSIKEFRWANTHLADPSIASGSCYVASERFLRFLKKRGVVSNRMVDSKEVEVEYAGGVFHWYFRLGRIVIDWTYRQFDHSCRFPHIWRKSA